MLNVRVCDALNMRLLIGINDAPSAHRHALFDEPVDLLGEETNPAPG